MAAIANDHNVCSYVKTTQIHYFIALKDTGPNKIVSRDAILSRGSKGESVSLPFPDSRIFPPFLVYGPLP